MATEYRQSYILALPFAVLVIAGAAAAVISLRDGVVRENPLLVILGALFGVLAAFGVYETYALATGRVPTISVVANQEYVAHSWPWIAVFGVVVYCAGLLTEHFTWNKAFHWQVIVLGAGLFLLGGVTSVLTRFTP